MPASKLNPLSVAGPRVILPISSLSPGLEEIATVATPIVAAALPTPGANRPSFADYQVTGQGSGVAVADQHDLSRLLAIAADERPLAAQPMAAATIDTVIDSAKAASGVTHAVSVAAAVDVLTAPAVAASTILDGSSLTDHHGSFDFAVAAPTAFRMPDGVAMDWHQPCTMPMHDVLPIDGMALLLG